MSLRQHSWERKTPSYETSVRCADSEETLTWPEYIFTLMPGPIVKAQAAPMCSNYLCEILVLYKGGRKFS